MATETTAEQKYFVPSPAPWPFLLTASLMISAIGAGVWLNGSADAGMPIFAIGMLLIFAMVFFWLRSVVKENVAGVYSHWEDRTYRIGMGWFIFTEVMFFGAFFGALFYLRVLSQPWLGGVGEEFYTHFYLWPDYTGGWPSNGPADVGGAFSTVAPWHLPLLNTILLLTSSVTVTWAHWGLKDDNRVKLCLGLLATIVLGAAFLYFQAMEYMEAYQHLGLTLGSGVYGSTFFMLTGFHGMHVTLGTVMLTVILLRSLAGHFSSHDHFGFEAVAWYWHFVDVVWLCLFVFVYVL